MVSNMKKTLAGVALAALPLMASAQMNEMQDRALADVNGQLGIIDITNLGFNIGYSLIDVPGGLGLALIDPIDVLEAVIDPIDIDLTNFGPTFGIFELNIGLFDVIPGAGPAIFDLPEAVFKTGILGGILGGVGTTYILQNGLTLPLPNVTFTPVRVI